MGNNPQGQSPPSSVTNDENQNYRHPNHLNQRNDPDKKKKPLFDNDIKQTVFSGNQNILSNMIRDEVEGSNRPNQICFGKQNQNSNNIDLSISNNQNQSRFRGKKQLIFHDTAVFQHDPYEIQIQPHNTIPQAELFNHSLSQMAYQGKKSNNQSFQTKKLQGLSY